jgi:hypothetical protein
MCHIDGVSLRYRLFREADTWLIGIDINWRETGERSVYREFTSYRDACRFANADCRRRQTFRIVGAA